MFVSKSLQLRDSLTAISLPRSFLKDVLTDCLYFSISIPHFDTQEFEVHLVQKIKIAIVFINQQMTSEAAQWGRN